MELLSLYNMMIKSRSIEKIEIADLDTILQGQDEFVKIVTVKPPAIILSNKKIIRCAMNYYINKDNDRKATANIRCFYAKKYLFGTSAVNAKECGGLSECVDCHLRCMKLPNLRIPLQDSRKQLEQEMRLINDSDG